MIMGYSKDQIESINAKARKLVGLDRPDQSHEGHHDELGRPSRPFSSGTGQTRQVRQFQIEISDEDHRIYCRVCGDELMTFDQLFNHRWHL